MYKVVIIDDEPIIVEGLSKGMKWNEWDCKVAGTAGDGGEGFKLVRDIKPDILISDIQMPRIDGLTMIAGLKSEFPNLQISILTGFREFDYAKRALELGVSRFLLKPSKISELEEAISAMTGRLKELGIKATDDVDSAGEQASGNAGSFIVNKALEYIKEHYKEKLMLQDVADEVYVSQWHLSKLLNKHLNQNLSEILNGVRIDKAKELLQEPSLRICDIADEVGFLDVAHFSRVFKKIVGISANEYRNSIK